MCYVIWGWLGISILAFLCLYHKIKLAIAVLKTASKYVGDVKTSVLVPVFNIIILVIFWAFWVVGLLYIYSVGSGQCPTSLTGPFTFNVNRDSKTTYMVIYFLFGGLWKNAFI